MVTVVSKQPHASVIKETICRNCGCTLQYVPRDIKERTVSDYLGDRDIIKYIDREVVKDNEVIKYVEQCPNVPTAIIEQMNKAATK